VDEPPETTSSLLTSNALDMYERHRREFERSISRLEKVDHYSFFLGDVPEEFQESYSNDDLGHAFSSMSHTSSTDAQETTVQASLSATGQPDHIPSSSRGAPNVKTASQDCFPDHPPYNFIIIRQRMNHGRYVIDRASIEELERRQRLAPYFQSLGKELAMPSSHGNATTSRTLFPKGINWTLLRHDVIGMCDGALERNPELGSGGPGTLIHSAKKIKEALEQVYEKTGKRHDAEIALANDRHRFSTAMAASENNAAAMQVKWRKTGKTLATFLVHVWGTLFSCWDQKKASSLTILLMLVYFVTRQPFRNENMSD
jgi:[histone H3]-lysine4 N-trimethyltransferase ATXR3